MGLRRLQRAGLGLYAEPFRNMGLDGTSILRTVDWGRVFDDIGVEDGLHRTMLGKWLQPMDRGTTAGTVPAGAVPPSIPDHFASAPGKKLARARYPWNSGTDGDLVFNKGDVLEITSEESPGEGWVSGLLNGASGILPANYLELNDDGSIREVLPVGTSDSEISVRPASTVAWHGAQHPSTVGPDATLVSEHMTTDQHDVVPQEQGAQRQVMRNNSDSDSDTGSGSGANSETDSGSDVGSVVGHGAGSAAPAVPQGVAAPQNRSQQRAPSESETDLATAAPAVAAAVGETRQRAAQSNAAEKEASAERQVIEKAAGRRADEETVRWSTRESAQQQKKETVPWQATQEETAQRQAAQEEEEEEGGAARRQVAVEDAARRQAVEGETQQQAPKVQATPAPRVATTTHSETDSSDDSDLERAPISRGRHHGSVRGYISRASVCQTQVPTSLTREAQQAVAQSSAARQQQEAAKAAARRRSVREASIAPDAGHISRAAPPNRDRRLADLSNHQTDSHHSFVPDRQSSLLTSSNAELTEDGSSSGEESDNPSQDSISGQVNERALPTSKATSANGASREVDCSHAQGGRAENRQHLQVGPLFRRQQHDPDDLFADSGDTDTSDDSDYSSRQGVRSSERATQAMPANHRLARRMEARESLGFDPGRRVASPRAKNAGKGRRSRHDTEQIGRSRQQPDNRTSSSQNIGRPAHAGARHSELVNQTLEELCARYTELWDQEPKGEFAESKQWLRRKIREKQGRTSTKRYSQTMQRDNSPDLARRLPGSLRNERTPVRMASRRKQRLKGANLHAINVEEAHQSPRRGRLAAAQSNHAVAPHGEHVKCLQNTNFDGRVDSLGKIAPSAKAMTAESNPRRDMANTLDSAKLQALESQLIMVQSQLEREKMETSSLRVNIDQIMRGSDASALLQEQATYIEQLKNHNVRLESKVMALALRHSDTGHDKSIQEMQMKWQQQQGQLAELESVNDELMPHLERMMAENEQAKQREHDLQYRLAAAERRAEAAEAMAAAAAQSQAVIRNHSPAFFPERHHTSTDKLSAAKTSFHQHNIKEPRHAYDPHGSPIDLDDVEDDHSAAAVIGGQVHNLHDDHRQRVRSNDESRTSQDVASNSPASSGSALGSPPIREGATTSSQDAHLSDTWYPVSYDRSIGAMPVHTAGAQTAPTNIGYDSVGDYAGRAHNIDGSSGRARVDITGTQRQIALFICSMGSIEYAITMCVIVRCSGS